MITVTVPAATFIATTPRKLRGRPSALTPFRDGLFELYSRGYGPAQMRDWLKLNGVNICPTSVREYIRRELSKGGVEEEE